MAINLEGLFTPPAPEDRNIAYLDVDYNGTIYKWQAYIPLDVNISEYLQSIESRIYREIDTKEAIWAALDPKTETTTDPLTGESITTEIQKDYIVKPDIPDYYAKRRAEYPPIGDQLGALWKGSDSPEYAALMARIEEVKNKYPKP